MRKKNKIFFLSLACVVLQFLDWFSTNLSLARGYLELNPIANFFIREGLWTEFLYLKLVIVLGLIGVCLAIKKYDSLVRILWVMNVVMVLVACNNFFWLLWG